jgi:signal peptidase I
MNLSSSLSIPRRSAMNKKLMLRMFLILFLLMFMWLQPYKLVVIVGESMMPTLHTRQIVIATKAKEIRRGDIVVFRNDFGEIVVKRVAYVAGDYYYYHVSKNGEFELIDSSYNSVLDSIDLYGSKTIIENKVPLKKIYVLGDNYNNSDDSRRFGTIELADVMYKLVR